MTTTQQKSLKNDRLIRALAKEKVDRTPVWIMRQAGRYLPEYRELRRQVPDFMTFCKTPELACEAALQPLRRFSLDAAILFSDILTVPEAMGMKLEFLAGEGPCFHNPISNQQDVDNLRLIDPNQELHYVMETLRLLKIKLNHEIPLIGFSGSPWTLAVYMVEGQPSKQFKLIKTMLYRQPEVLKNLLEKLTQVTIRYLNAQIKNGAQALMVFDTWGGVLSFTDYPDFSLRYLKMIAEQVACSVDGKKIPLIFFGKGVTPHLKNLAQSGCDAVGLDYTVDIGNARNEIGSEVSLQGNLDPFALFGSRTSIKNAVHAILKKFGPHPGHIFNLGHGIDLDTPIESVDALIAAVHSYSN